MNQLDMHMSQITRFFVQTYPKPSEFDSIGLKPIEAFLHHKVLVIVGEPGLGKTTSFKQAEASELQSEFIPIGEFLACTDPSIYKHKALYLDGLDEQRSKYSGQGVMDALVAKIKQSQAAKIRVSCRTAEWHGEQDLKSLEYAIPKSQTVQLSLQPLTEVDWPNLIPDQDVADFIQGAVNHGLQDFLNNPGDFILLHQYYQDVDEWPATRAELMDGACRSLLKELNQEHYEALDDRINDIALQKSSEYLAAVMLLSGVEGISTSRRAASRSFPSIHQFDDELFCMRVASRRRLFSPLENERIAPRHRKIAEYMAARYLARRVREGLSLRRLMTLLTGFDGKTAPELRGVYAWLVTLLAGSAEKVIHHDPYGALIYGDTYSWTPHTKKVAIKALKELSLQDAWFRHGDHSVKELGGLADNTTANDFINYITNEEGNSHFLCVLFDALSASNGINCPELEQVLIDYVGNNEKPDHLRDDAINAISNTSFDSSTVLLKILNRVNSGEIQDNKQYLRGALLEHLYPNQITPEQITTYLIEPCSGIIGSYYMLVVYKLVECTPSEKLESLVESAYQWLKESKKSKYQYRFLNALSLRVLNEFYDDASVENIYKWLCLNVGDYEHNTLDNTQKDKLSFILNRDTTKLFNLFLHFVDLTIDEENSSYQIWWRFDELVCHSLSQQLFIETAYKYVSNKPYDIKIQNVFELLCRSYFSYGVVRFEFDLDDLEHLAIKNNNLNDALMMWNMCSLEHQGWRLEEAQRKSKRLEEKRKRLSENKEEIFNLYNEIKQGNEAALLEHYAKVWLGQYSDVDHKAEPKKRLSDEVGIENVPIILEGFKNVLFKDVFNSVKDIAEAHLNGSVYYRASLFLVSLTVLFEDKGKDLLLSLPDKILKLAISYQLTKPSEHNFEWINCLIISKPEIYQLAIEEYWRIQLDKDAKKLSGHHRFRGDEDIFPVAINIIPKLLNDYKKIDHCLLRIMLENIVGTVDFTTCLSLVKTALQRRHLRRNGTKAMWLSVGFMCDSSLYFAPLLRELNVNVDAKWHAKSFLLSDVFLKNNDEKYIRSAEYRKDVAVLLAPHFNNVREETSGMARFIGDRDASETARGIRSLIRTFADDSSDEATLCLEELKSLGKLNEWQSEVSYATADHIRNVREARFSYPSTHSVVSTLSNSEPANVSDLKALIIDILYEIADEIRNSNTDIYKWFWNHGKDGKANHQHINENNARDILLELLRTKLKFLDIVAEPEVMYADEKRADIAIYYKWMKLPIEIKRDDHNKIWSAAEEQLERQYSRDHASEGNGIYLLFWFDGKGMTNPPKHIEKPKTAIELKQAIDLVIPERSLGLIESIIIDVSVPEVKRSRDPK